MNNGSIGHTATFGDTIRIEVYVASRSHLERIWVRFAKVSEGPRQEAGYIEGSGEVLDYQAGGTGRTNKAVLALDTTKPPETGEYWLQRLEVLTAGNRWLSVKDFPLIVLQIEPEPEDDEPLYEGMTFYDQP